MTISEEKKEHKHKLLEEKEKLCIEKKHHEVKLAKIKNLIRTSKNMSGGTYSQCCQSQDRHKFAIGAIQEKLLKIKTQLRIIYDEENDKYERIIVQQGGGTSVKHALINRDVIIKLSEIRQQYQEFAADSTRVSSMRQMAAEFVVKLNPVIKQAINEE